jgi:hypothetical protein
MSCGNNYNGWGGGCGCANTVQYAPPACNPNFPTYCTKLGDGNIVRLVGEDSAYCKYTVPTLFSNSLLSYNASTGLVKWNDGTSANPIFISPNTQTQTSGSLLATSALSGNSGQLVELFPASTTEATFPIVPIGGSTVNWGTIEDIVPNQGIVYKNSSNVVAQASLGTAGQILTMVSGVPAFATPTPNGFVDARSVNISFANITQLTVNFGNLVVNSNASSIAINNSSSYTLNLSNGSLPNSLDTGTLIASTYYYVFAIYNSTTLTVATLASLSPNAPTLPTGYTHFRLIGLFRTNSSSQIDALYNQNGRAVNLGQTANVVVTTQATQANNKYWSGSVTYAPYQYVDKAFLRFSLIGTSASQTANVIISNTTAGATGATQPPLATTSEIYGAFIVAPAYGTSTNAVYGTTTTVIPNNSNSYFNIYTTAVLGTGDSFALQISGYELSFL